jgi:hypothetical protein
MSELTEWKLAIVTELVLAVLPETPEEAIPWEDVASRVVWEYQRDRARWQEDDPMFDLYQDNFINKNYILNKRFQIRDNLARQGLSIPWRTDGRRGQVYLARSVEAMEQQMSLHRRRIEGFADGYNARTDKVHKVHPESTIPYLHTTRQLPATIGQETN